MRRRNYDRKQIAVIVLISAVMLAAAAFLNYMEREGAREASSTQAAISSPAAAAATEGAVRPVPTPDATERIATYLQGPKSWKARREWSGRWGTEYYDGGSFGGFGCGLCCMANIYCSLTDYRCSPLDMYRYAMKESMYAGGGAIDWGYMKDTMTAAGFTCNVGHYVTLFLYDENTDRIFLADSGDPAHNRHWVPLKKIYRSLKTANNWQYMAVVSYDEKRDGWKHTKISGRCILPPQYK